MVAPKSLRIVWDRKARNHFKDILAYLEKQNEKEPLAY